VIRRLEIAYDYHKKSAVNIILLVHFNGCFPGEPGQTCYPSGSLPLFVLKEKLFEISGTRLSTALLSYNQQCESTKGILLFVNMSYL